ncbi:MAG TPA: hypothetical protein VF169_15795 [Albitalea sp.]|uniref:hypothetical protein n=1 Tax=Piscinibacter sp. TaxID=1903157 RepID=UPI002ED55A39
MTTFDNASSASFHKRLGWGYLFGAVTGLVASAIALSSAAPLLVKLFLPFPGLADATHWEGRVETRGDFRIGTVSDTIPQHFIITSSGRHEFKCGYIGHRIPCANYQLLDGATGEVWYHPVFGALQWRFTIQRGQHAGKVEERAIADRESFFRENFFYSRYVTKLLVALAGLAVSLWLFVRSINHRASAAIPFAANDANKSGN